jgi:hypothetical protein
MPLFLILIGVVLVVTALNNTFHGSEKSLVGLIKNDFSGPNNFLIWMVALFICGAFGYIKGFKPISYAFLGLVFVAIVLANQKGERGGLFVNFFNAINGAYKLPPADPTGTTTNSNGGSGGSTQDLVKTGVQLAKYFA